MSKDLKQIIGMNEINHESFDYEVILPIKIRALNNALDLSGKDEMVYGMHTYGMPEKILGSMEPTNMGQICIDSKGEDKISIKCEHRDHAEGFLKFYVNNMMGYGFP